MAYSNFSLKQVKRQFDLTESKDDIFTDIPVLPYSEWLTETLRRGQTLGLASEKERSELLVMPILLESKFQQNNAFSLYSGQNLEADKELGLNGECDFILSLAPQSIEIESPIFCMVEAKKHDVMEGLGQCVAQMLGARILNKKEGKNIETIFGCVTNANDWQFMQLSENHITIHKNLFFLNNIGGILGFLQKVWGFYGA